MSSILKLSCSSKYSLILSTYTSYLPVSSTSKCAYPNTSVFEMYFLFPDCNLTSISLRAMPYLSVILQVTLQVLSLSSLVFPNIVLVFTTLFSSVMTSSSKKYPDGADTTFIVCSVGASPRNWISPFSLVWFSRDFPVSTSVTISSTFGMGLLFLSKTVILNVALFSSSTCFTANDKFALKFCIIFLLTLSF